LQKCPGFAESPFKLFKPILKYATILNVRFEDLALSNPLKSVAFFEFKDKYQVREAVRVSKEHSEIFPFYAFAYFSIQRYQSRLVGIFFSAESLTELVTRVFRVFRSEVRFCSGIAAEIIDAFAA